MSGKLPAGIIGNTEIGANPSAPITYTKMQHRYKHTTNFGYDLLLTRKRHVATRAKVGGTAGWTVGAADDLPYVATLAAGQTGSTLIIPIDGLQIGDVITGFKVNAQIESAGNTVTLDADLRAVTNAAAEPTDASIGTMTQVSVTADTATAQEKTGLSEVVTAGKSYYLKLTGTTGAATDVILLHPEIYTQDGLVTREVVLFVADSAGVITEVGAGLETDGSSTAISFDLIARPSTSKLSATIDVTDSTGDRTEVDGTISGTGAYASGDVVSAKMTVTSAVGASGPWMRVVRMEDGV